MKPSPVVIGATGHRDLRGEDVPALEALLRAQFAAWRARCPRDFVLTTSLAEGADQLAARAALETGMRLHAVLPMPAADYERDFAGTALAAFRDLLRQADAAMLAPDAEGRADGSRDYLYRQAAIRVARQCDVLVALWDGLPGKPSGCGTAETVGFALRGANGAVWQAVTPRRGAPVPARALTGILYENAPSALAALLGRVSE